MQRIFLIGLTALLTACANQPSQQAQGNNEAVLSPVTTYYDYQFASAKGEPIALNQLPSALIDADVVLIGEWHTHSAVHRFQTDFLKARLADSKDVALSMEQFTRQHQNVIDDYLAGEIGEQVLMSDAAAWPSARVTRSGRHPSYRRRKSCRRRPGPPLARWPACTIGRQTRESGRNFDGWRSAYRGRAHRLSVTPDLRDRSSPTG